MTDSNESNGKNIPEILRLTFNSLNRHAQVTKAEGYSLANGAERVRLTLNVTRADTTVELIYDFPAEGQRWEGMCTALVPEADDANIQFTLDDLVGRWCVVALDMRANVTALIRTERAIQKRLVRPRLGVQQPPRLLVSAPPRADLPLPQEVLGLTRIGESAPCTMFVASTRASAAGFTGSEIELGLHVLGERGMTALHLTVTRPSPTWTELVSALLPGSSAEVELSSLVARSCEAVGTAVGGAESRLWVELGRFGGGAS